MKPVAAALAVLAAACGEQTAPFKQPIKLAGKEVSAEKLNDGRVAYLQYCRACHGEKGDGKGPAAPGLRPPPRDFTQGSFKFAGVLDQKLPRDEDLVRIVRGGLHGTAMVGWEVPDRKLDEIIQYIKTLSPKWREDDAVGDPVQVPPDPWGDARKTEAIERGKQLYHGFAQCLGCHAAYAPKQYIYDASKATLGTGTTDFRPGMYQPELKDSEYGVKVLPPDFLFNELRSIQPGSELHDLYRILVAGVTGAAMPAWNPVTLPNKEADIYALAWYIRSLVELKGTEAAYELRQRLAHEPPFQPPPDAK
ncbi:MAG TPA: c-type cytochrome [Myxococcales bacterium]|nr:c-type cytochrome [Myxococcales bacterium]